VALLPHGGATRRTVYDGPRGPVPRRGDFAGFEKGGR